MAQVEVNNVTVSQGVRMLFSLVTPNESSFATVQEVPTLRQSGKCDVITAFMEDLGKQQRD